MALHIPPAAAWPLDNANETLSVDDIISHLSDDPLLGISPLDFFHAPPVVDPPSPVKLSPCKTEIGDEDGSGTSHAPSPASPSPVTSRDSSAPPKRTSPKDKGSPKGRSKPSVAIRRIKREEATSKKVAVPPTHPTFPRRANRTPATYVYDASPLSSETDPDNDEEWKPDDIMISDHEDDSSNSNIGYDEKAIRLAPMGVPLIAPPANAAIAACGGTERQRIRSFAQQREIRNRTADSESAGWIDHGGQFLCKAIIRQASKKGRAKWLPGCEPEVGKPCNQLLGTYQDWERHFSCSQWHQEPDTCRFCAKSLNVRSVERHLSKSTTSLCSSAIVCLTPFRACRFMQELQAPIHSRTNQALS